jgi:parallel beta-helix repeat protein
LAPPPQSRDFHPRGAELVHRPIALGLAIMGALIAPSNAFASEGSVVNGARSRTMISVTPTSNLQRAIDRANAGSTILFTPGTYSLDAALSLKSGVYLQCMKGAEIVGWQSRTGPGIASGRGVNDVTISNCVFDAGATGGPTGLAGAFYIDDSVGNGTGTWSTDVKFIDNTFQNWSTSGANVFYLWRVSSMTIYGNIFTNDYQPVSWHSNDAATAVGQNVIAANTFTDSNATRIDVEVQRNVDNLHVDWNTVFPAARSPQPSVSIVAYGSVKVDTGGTIWGNKFMGHGDAKAAIELADSATSVESNTISGYAWGLSLASGPNSEIKNNTFTNVVRGPISEDGGYTNNWWIGNNDYAGGNYGGASGIVAGWVGPGSGSHGPYGACPPVNRPSPRP